MSTRDAAPPDTRADLFPAAGRTPFLAVTGIVISIALTALSVFWDITGNDPEPEENPLGQFIVVVGIIVIVAAVVYLLVVRTAARGNPGRRSLVLAILGAVSLVVFWAGLPVVLASAATAAALIDRNARGRLGGMAVAGLVLAILTTLAAIGLAIAG